MHTTASRVLIPSNFLHPASCFILLNCFSNTYTNTQRRRQFYLLKGSLETKHLVFMNYLLVTGISQQFRLPLAYNYNFVKRPIKSTLRYYNGERLAAVTDCEVASSSEQVVPTRLWKFMFSSTLKCSALSYLRHVSLVHGAPIRTGGIRSRWLLRIMSLRSARKLFPSRSVYPCPPSYFSW